MDKKNDDLSSIRAEDEKKEDIFVPAPLYKEKLENNRRYDFVKLFEQCNKELSLQQKKRDQIITLYWRYSHF